MFFIALFAHGPCTGRSNYDIGLHRGTSDRTGVSQFTASD